MSTIGITGASGQLGRLVADQLLDGRGVAASDLVLVTRSTDKLADLAARGVQVRHGDFADPATLADAFAGVERLLLISTDDIVGRLPHQRAAIEAAESAGVAHVLYTSVGNPVAENPVAVGPSHRGTEEALRASGLAWTFLRNALYAEFQIPDFQHAITSGQLFSNGGDGATTYISRADCAAAAAGALTSDGHENVVYDVTGTQLLTAADRAALAAELGGRDVELVLVDDDAYIAGLEAAGIPTGGAQMLATFGQAIREGFFDQLTDHAEKLAGRPPKPLRDVIAPALRSA